jgi:hypothetical protein
MTPIYLDYNATTPVDRRPAAAFPTGAEQERRQTRARRNPPFARPRDDAERCLSCSVGTAAAWRLVAHAAAIARVG